MCGIFGYVGQPALSLREKAHELLASIFCASNARGKDASGFAARQIGGQLVTEKRNIDSKYFINRSARFNSLAYNMPSIFIGHTRQATSGDPKQNRNNHPFLTNKWALVHNGRVEDWKGVVERCNISMRSETDSEVLVHFIHDGPNPAQSIDRMVKSIPEGSKYAVAFMEHSDLTHPKTLYLFRNTNPTHLLKLKAWNMIYFASTKEILEEGMKMAWGPQTESIARSLGAVIESTDPFTLYAINVGEKDVLTLTNTKIAEPVKAPVAKPPMDPTSDGEVCEGFTPSVESPNTYGPEWGKRRATAHYKDSDKESKPGNPVMDENEASNVSNGTRERVSALQAELNSLMEIVNHIQNSPGMTDAEYKDWEKWANRKWASNPQLVA